MWKFLLVAALVLILTSGCAGSSGKETLTEVGQPAPTFTLDLLGGENFDLADQRGKVVLINWFATWCPPCQEEMPHLEKEVWQRFQGEGFAMVSVAREENADVVAPFVAKYGVTWPFALDPDRAAFAKYATSQIPRNTVLDRNGKIIFQSVGFEREDFDDMIDAIAEALDPAP